MNKNDMSNEARVLAAKAIDDLYNKDGWKKIVVLPDDMYVVWFSKTLQNWKALVSTNVIHTNDELGDYVEVTHNGDKNETYCDVYKKQFNKAYPDDWKTRE